jgi:hypothetical protein
LHNNNFKVRKKFMVNFGTLPTKGKGPVLPPGRIRPLDFWASASSPSPVVDDTFSTSSSVSEFDLLVSNPPSLGIRRAPAAAANEWRKLGSFGASEAKPWQLNNSSLELSVLRVVLTELDSKDAKDGIE